MVEKIMCCELKEKKTKGRKRNLTVARMKIEEVCTLEMVEALKKQVKTEQNK